MKKLKKMYYHPDLLNAASPVVGSAPHYEAIVHFLQTAERIESNLLSDLEPIADIFTPVVSEALDEATWPELWGTLTRSTHPECTKFREELFQWASKYNLVDPEVSQPLYINIAIAAIADYAEALADSKNETKWEPVTILWPDDQGEYRKSVVVSESEDIPKLSLSDAVDIQDGLPEEQFSEWFPFSFTPTLEAMKAGLKADAYESALRRESSSIEGLGWDPRDPWDEFEKRMRWLFDRYLRSYKGRAEAQIRKFGYVPGPTKDVMEHFEWLVLFQIKQPNWTQDEIATEYNTTRENVSTQSGKVAALIGLQIKSSKTGPKRSK